MTLKRNGTIIARASAVGNMFLFDVIVSTTLIVRGKPSIFRGAIKQKDTWHRRLCYAGHARIQAAARIITGIELKTAE